MKAVIFDMDGVIADTEPIYIDLNRKFFASRGIGLEEVGYEQFVGISARKMWHQIKTRFSLAESVEWLIDREVDTFFSHLSSLPGILPIPGIPDLLFSVSQTGAKIGLASSSAHRNIDLILEKTNLGSWFSVIASGQDVLEGKPAPDIFIETAKRLDVDPKNCIVVEDSENGVKAGKAANMTVVGFKNPGSGNQNLSKADLIIHDFALVSRNQILEHLKTNF